MKKKDMIPMISRTKHNKKHSPKGMESMFISSAMQSGQSQKPEDEGLARIAKLREKRIL
jgi:hypothetical protein